MRDPVCVNCGAAIDKARAALNLDHCETCAKNVPGNPLNVKEYHLEVAGISYRRDDFLRAQVSRGDVLVLKPEPKNVHDANAIAVYKGDIMIGYIPRTHNWLVLEPLKASLVTCSVEAAWPRGCCILVSVKEQ